MIQWKDGRFRFKVRQVLGITLVWTLIGMMDAVNTHIMSLGTYLEPTPAYHFGNYFFYNTATAAIAGLLSGGLLVFYLRDQLRNFSFGLALVVNALVIVLLNFCISLVTYGIFLTMSPGGLQLEEGAVLEQAHRVIFSPFYFKNLIFWMMVVFLTLIMLNVNEKYGPGIFNKLLLGRYHRPREEERIFMFVDIRSSTSIAEKLGHIRFFNLLNDFYHDITNPILFTAGEIFQYVGDEVVISWTMEKGVKNANCIQCFYKMQEAIRQQAPWYLEKYGLVPEFKAGLHCGPVTVGEIGVIKKDIVFSGDVMNTTSRIQSVCNKFRVRILFSKYLLDLLNLPPHGHQPKRVGIIELKGKKQKVELYTLEEILQPTVTEPPSPTIPR